MPVTFQWALVTRVAINFLYRFWTIITLLLIVTVSGQFTHYYRSSQFLDTNAVIDCSSFWTITCITLSWIFPASGPSSLYHCLFQFLDHHHNIIVCSSFWTCCLWRRQSSVRICAWDCWDTAALWSHRRGPRPAPPSTCWWGRTTTSTMHVYLTQTSLKPH